MAGSQHYFPVFETLMATAKINLLTDILNMGLVASGTFVWGSTPEGYEFVSQFLGGDGTNGALTEVSTSGTGYTRQALTSVTYTASGELVTFSSASVLWSNATFTAKYAFLYDASVGANDAAHPIIAYWDFGGAQSPSGVPFQLTVTGAGLGTWTAS